MKPNYQSNKLSFLQEEFFEKVLDKKPGLPLGDDSKCLCGAGQSGLDLKGVNGI
jgi:hypothetical protein